LVCGKIDHNIKAKVRPNNGVKINPKTFEVKGLVCSFVKSLRASANGWGSPIIPTLFGPFRIWIYPNTLRSINVKKAIPIRAII